MKLTHNSFFSGIGGFDIGAKEAGFKNLLNVEIDEFRQSVLKKLNPDSILHNDILSLLPNVELFRKEIPEATVWTAGFPCQDITINNKKAKGIINGKRSSLFFTFFKLVEEFRPTFVVLENSYMLRKRGLHEVLSCFAQIGYDVEWQTLRASDFGYPHQRSRMYIIASNSSKIRPERPIFKPLKTIELSKSWTPTETYFRITRSRTDGYRNFRDLQRGDVVPNFGNLIGAYGDSVMPIITEYLFKCIKESMR